MKNRVLAQLVLNVISIITFAGVLMLDNPGHKMIGNVIGWIFLLACWVMMYINYKK